MPRNNHRHENITAGITTFRRYTSPENTPSKPNPRFLSLLLQALIMVFIISLFFVFIGVVAIIFINLCIAGGALHRRRHQNRRRPISDEDEISSGYSSDELKTLPKSRFKGNSETCPICLDGLFEGENCRVLPFCNHVFHLGCVDKWLKKVPACPVCRSSVRSSNSEAKRMDGIDWEQLWTACG